MATTADASLDFDKKYHFLLRKLHSLTGIIPIGVFLIEHMFTNSAAFFGGRDGFNSKVHFLHSLPFLTVLEIVGIFLPLAFHAAYGLKIAFEAEHNPVLYPYMGNWRYTLQRLTGYIAVLFIIVHLLKYRFAPLVGWGPEFIHEGNNYFEITRRGLMAWSPWKGFVMPPWATLSMYVVGLTAAVYHFCNGIWSFCISWGITVGPRAQKRVGFAACGLAVVLLSWGYLSLWQFAKAEAGPLQFDTHQATRQADSITAAE